MAAVAIVMTRGYLVTAAVVPAAQAARFTAWPAATIATFIAMLFGATLGGNANLIGASAIIVAAGLRASNGRPVTFMKFVRCGLPNTFCQLAVSTLYVVAMFGQAG